MTDVGAAAPGTAVVNHPGRIEGDAVVDMGSGRRGRVTAGAGRDITAVGQVFTVSGGRHAGGVTDAAGARFGGAPGVAVAQLFDRGIPFAVLVTGVGSAAAEAAAGRQAAAVSQGNRAADIEVAIDMVTGRFGFGAPVGGGIVTAGTVDGDTVDRGCTGMGSVSLPSGSTGVGHIVVTEDAARIVGPVVPAVTVIERRFAVVTIDVRAGIGGTVVNRIRIRCPPEGFGVTPAAVGDKNIGIETGHQAVIIIIADRRMTILTNRFLLGIIIHGDIVVTVTEPLPDRQHMHIMFTDFVVGRRDIATAAVRPVLTGSGITVATVTTGFKGRRGGM